MKGSTRRLTISAERKVSREASVLKTVVLQAISPLILATPAIVFIIGRVISGVTFTSYTLVLYSAVLNLMRFSVTLNAIVAFKVLIPFKEEFVRRILRKKVHPQNLFTLTPTVLSRRHLAVERQSVASEGLHREFEAQSRHYNLSSGKHSVITLRGGVL